MMLSLMPYCFVYNSIAAYELDAFNGICFGFGLKVILNCRSYTVCHEKSIYDLMMHKKVCVCVCLHRVRHVCVCFQADVCVCLLVRLFGAYATLLQCVHAIVAIQLNYAGASMRV